MTTTTRGGHDDRGLRLAPHDHRVGGTDPDHRVGGCRGSQHRLPGILSSLTVVDARVRGHVVRAAHASVSHRLHHVALARYSKNALTAAHHSALTELSGLLEDRGTVGDNEWLSSVLDAITVTPVRAVSA